MDFLIVWLQIFVLTDHQPVQSLLYIMYTQNVFGGINNETAAESTRPQVPYGKNGFYFSSGKYGMAFFKNKCSKLEKTVKSVKSPFNGSSAVLA